MALVPEAVLWKLTLCYDGSAFAGWQVQPGQRTVQGALAAALRRVTGEAVLPQGSGRTDAGVHALAQVASVLLRSPVPPANLQRALNNVLPVAIRILRAEHAPSGFHARHSALRKTYEYRIWRAPLCLPWLAPYVCAYTFPLKLEPMWEAAKAVLGTHDFTSFQAPEPDGAARAKSGVKRALERERDLPSVPSGLRNGPVLEPVALRTIHPTIRTLFQSEWETPEPDLLVYRVCGSGFLHHMVRNLIGTFLAVGRGQIASSALPAILAARVRAAAGPTAPACGLWLHSIEYPVDPPVLR